MLELSEIMNGYNTVDIVVRDRGGRISFNSYNNL